MKNTLPYALASFLLFSGVSHAQNTCTSTGTTVLQPGPSEGKDIWTTSVFSYAGNPKRPGGGLDNDELRVGGWGDEYHALIEFDTVGLPPIAQKASIELFALPYSDSRFVPVEMQLDRIVQPWDWRTNGTGFDFNRLWWADRPNSTLWTGDKQNPLPLPQNNSWYSIDVTNLYNAWQIRSNGIENFGVILRPTTNNRRMNAFISSNSLAHPTLRPKLVVDPYVPVQPLLAPSLAATKYQTQFRNSNGQGIVDNVLSRIDFTDASGPLCVFLNSPRVSDTQMISAILSTLDDLLLLVGSSGADLPMLNYGRNANQQPTTVSYQYVQNNGFSLASVDATEFHRSYVPNPSLVKKYTHNDGREYVFYNDPIRGQILLNDGVNDGTFNYDSNIVGHTVLDIMPWIVFGATPEDCTTPEERLQMFYGSAVMQSLWGQIGSGAICKISPSRTSPISPPHANSTAPILP
ncbi:DNRLRE domain-containing protein [Ruegeria sp. HKCCSP335]|uniref:DNRLRE domain-containing protein n=1 Tax=Ruegeria sp. HKCCSP335 TaxID=2794833 RepID=UPI001AE98C54|nr:DNRLRE domain-containing protein [Ruegeria sp. HKCCSP335]